jgi:peroxiredoxin
MIRSIVYPFLVIALLSCANREKPKDDVPGGGWRVTIRGKVGYPGTGEIRLTEIGLGDGDKEDTVKLKSNYSFEKTVTLTEPGYYRLNFYDLQYVDFILDRTDLEINVDGNSQAGFSEVNGSPDHALIVEMQSAIQASQSGPGFRKLESEFEQAKQRKSQEQMSNLQDQYMGELSRVQDSLLQTLIKRPLSLGMINILEGNMFDKDAQFKYYKQVADRIQSEWPASRYGKKFVEMVDKMAITAVGQPAPEISLPDQNGDTIKLSSLRGKYVLVDFWAKWCGPCRRENPNVVKAYAKYKNKGFEILGVSLDRSREDWVQAIAEDRLTWKHVSDLKYFNSQAALDYNINAIPFSILLDPNGVIIAKNLRGASLEKKLAEIFGKKS